MELRRVLRTFTDFLEELRIHRVVEQLGELNTAIQNAASAPSPAADEAFKTNLKSLFLELDQCASNEWPPDHKRHLSGLSLDTETGRGLRERVEDVLKEDGITRSIAVQNISELYEQVRLTQKHVARMVESFQWMNLEIPDPKIDGCEVAIVLPGEGSSATLAALDRDLDGFDRLLKFLNELSGQSGVSPRVVGLSSGSLVVYVQTLIDTAVDLVTIIGGILAIRQSVTELRKKAHDLQKDKDVPKEIIKAIEDVAEKKVEDGLAMLAIEVVTKSTSVDESRKNELKTGMSMSVRFLAKKLDEGVRIDVTPPQIADPGEASEEAQRQHLSIQARVEIIREKNKEIARLEGQQEPVLLLTDANEKNVERPEGGA